MVLRVIWQGAEYRGRGREVDWNGKVFISNNNFSNLVTINSFNHEKQIRLMNSKTIIWHSTTTGGQSGYEVLLDNLNGNLNFEINDKKISINLKTLKEKRIVKHFGGINNQVCFSLVSKDDSDKEFIFYRALPMAARKFIDTKDFNDICLMRIEAIGIKDNQRKSVSINAVEEYDDKTKLMAMEKWTGWHASIMMQHIASGNIGSGTFSVEKALTGHQFYDQAMKRNYTIKIEEQ